MRQFLIKFGDGRDDLLIYAERYFKDNEAPVMELLGLGHGHKSNRVGSWLEDGQWICLKNGVRDHYELMEGDDPVKYLESVYYGEVYELVGTAESGDSEKTEADDKCLLIEDLRLGDYVRMSDGDVGKVKGLGSGESGEEFMVIIQSLFGGITKRYGSRFDVKSLLSDDRVKELIDKEVLRGRMIDINHGLGIDLMDRDKLEEMYDKYEGLVKERMWKFKVDDIRTGEIMLAIREGDTENKPLVGVAYADDGGAYYLRLLPGETEVVPFGEIGIFAYITDLIPTRYRY